MWNDHLDAPPLACICNELEQHWGVTVYIIGTGTFKHEKKEQAETKGQNKLEM